MQTTEERVRATGTPYRTGSHLPSSELGEPSPPVPGGLANPGADSRNGSSGRSAAGQGGKPGQDPRENRTAQPPHPRPLHESRVPGASGLPEWVRCPERARVGSARCWQPGRAASAAGRGSRVRRGESLRSGARAASWEFSARRGRRELGLPGEPGTRRGPGPRRRGRRREWEGRRQRRTQPAEEAARGEAEPGQGPERGDQVP